MMKSISPHILTILFFLLVLQETLIFSAMADKQFIKQTCEGTPDYALCMSILSPNPKSQSADLTGLALILVDTVKVNGVKTLKQIDGLKKSRPELTPALNECANVYTAVVNVDVPSAVDALELGNPKFAEDGMADTAVESQACENSFGEHHLKSPMTATNKGMGDVANVARAIVRMLL